MFLYTIIQKKSRGQSAKEQITLVTQTYLHKKGLLYNVISMRWENKSNVHPLFN